MRLLLTRPLADSESITRQLRDQNISASIDPLMSLSFLENDFPTLTIYQAVIFTSPNGIRALKNANFDRNTKVFTVGNKTAEMAKAAEFKDITSADGDLVKLSDTINGQLDPTDGSLLYLCGKHQSGDLKQDMEARGFKLDKYEIYEMVAAENLSDQSQNLLKNQEIDYIPFYSARSAHIFIELIKKAGLQHTLTTVSALCLSPAIESVITSQNWKSIMTAEKPDQYTLFKLIDIEL